jgi:DNA-binding response OmpR family regulator
VKKSKLKIARGQTVLLVEDTETVRMFVTDYLENAGYRVVAAHDGAAGVAEAMKQHPDLI